MQIAVCDDEPIICEKIIEDILRLRPDYVIDVYYSGIKLIEKFDIYDMIFLDIEMPEKNGMSIANILRDQNYDGYIVFLTSHTEFMQEAFKVKAFRFLEKPIKQDLLIETIEQFEEEIFSLKKIVITDYGIEEIIDLKSIIYIEAVRKKTTIYTTTKTIETRNSLLYWEEKLGTREFCKVHKSFIVSLKYIKSVTDYRLEVRCLNQEIPISRRKFPKVKKTVFTYIEKHAKYM